MLGKPNLAVAAVLASTGASLLNSDKVDAYQRALADQKMSESRVKKDGINETTSVMALHQVMPDEDYHPGFIIRKAESKPQPTPQAQSPPKY